MKNLEFKEIFKIPDYDSAVDMTTGLIEFDDEKCTRCGICVQICPAGSIIMDKTVPGKKADLPYLDSVSPDVTLCIACGCCLAACPTDAISIKRQFNPGHFYKRLSQTEKMIYPHKY